MISMFDEFRGVTSLDKCVHMIRDMHNSWVFCRTSYPQMKMEIILRLDGKGMSLAVCWEVSMALVVSCSTGRSGAPFADMD